MTDNFLLLDRLLGAVAAGDFDGVREILAPDVRIWHNDGSGEQGLEENLASLRGLRALFTEYGYTVRRRLASEDVVLQTHVLTGTLTNGSPFTLDIAMYVEFRDGRVVRVEEYFDSAVIAALGGPAESQTVGELAR